MWLSKTRNVNNCPNEDTNCQYYFSEQLDVDSFNEGCIKIGSSCMVDNLEDDVFEYIERIREEKDKYIKFVENEVKNLNGKLDEKKEN